MTVSMPPDKAKYVQHMFGRIAPRYDLMNRLMTGGQDLRWRREMIRSAGLPSGGKLLDIAAGTGDVTIEALKLRPDIGLAVAADVTMEMIQQGKQRSAGRSIRWLGGDCLSLPFPDGAFDAVMSAFLMRNVTDIRRALQEQVRVTRPGGKVLVMDIPRPPQSLWGRLFRFYFHRLVPLLGLLVSGQREAYTYLPNSADAFLEPGELAAEMSRAGLSRVGYRHFMLGTVALHEGQKL
jgi:demethylmenaquinone methyltransferase / 2-methoxy-6-polyprenyl-1,4-benzoquinol methylase